MRRAENEHGLTVCERCLMGIECHEGKQITKEVYFDDEDGVCEWCEEEGFAELVEILGSAEDF